MAHILHAFGTAHLLGGSGALDALEEIGVSVDGITITLNNYFDDVMTDHFGPRVPYDLQYFLSDAIIEAELVWWDWDILNKWLPGAPGLSTEGVMGLAGELMQQELLMKRLLVRSTPTGLGITGVEECWNFPNVVLIDQAEQKVGVQKTVFRLKFRALPTQQASGSEGAVLYNTTCT